MIAPEHELHRRRRGRNAWIGGLLAGFVLLIFVVTLVKLSTGVHMTEFGHATDFKGIGK